MRQCLFFPKTASDALFLAHLFFPETASDALFLAPDPYTTEILPYSMRASGLGMYVFLKNLTLVRWAGVRFFQCPC